MSTALVIVTPSVYIWTCIIRDFDINIYIYRNPQFYSNTHFAKCIWSENSHDGVIKWKHFPITGHLCGEFTGPGDFAHKGQRRGAFDVLFDLRLNKRLSKQSWGWWFETQSRPLWRHCNSNHFFFQLTTFPANNGAQNTLCGISFHVPLTWRRPW